MLSAPFQHINFAILDAARIGQLMGAIKHYNKRFQSLYREFNNNRLEAVAPHLFFTVGAKQFMQYVLRAGYGCSWGVYLKSNIPAPELATHFRRFLKIKTESGNNLYFRFYDPRVLRIFLPTCDAAQLRDFFGNGAVDYFIMEDEDPAFALRMWHENGTLKTERLPVAETIAALPEPELLAQKTAQDELTPETLAVIAELRKQYPDIVFPGDEQQQETDAKAQATAGPEQPQQAQSANQSSSKPAAPLPPKKPAFSMFADDDDVPQKPLQKHPEEQPQASSKPDPSKLKPKWNLFD